LPYLTSREIRLMRRASLQSLVRRAIATNALGLAAMACGGDSGFPTGLPDAPAPSTVRTATAEPLVDVATTRCLDDGAVEGEWLVRFNGYGCAQVEHDAGGASFSLSPREAVGTATTHAGLVIGPMAGARLAFRVDVMTARQLRTSAQPNPWEVAWVVWHYADDEHFYYFIPKPNGWELGKRDPAYPGGQRFLATGSASQYPVGRWHAVSVAQHDSTMTVQVNGVPLVTFTDGERPYVAGRVGLYSEDATVLARDARID
jgi:hypothetical protein